MIKMIKSKLSVKVFFITLMMIICCTVTYSCIARFFPYIYTYKLSDIEVMADTFSAELSHASFDEAKNLITALGDAFSQDYDDEFVIHIF